jgi:hypothetical protein
LQVEPQALASSSGAQELPHWCRPEAQVNAQVPLVVQVTLAEPSGAGHGAHKVPQEFGLVLEAQTSLQMCDPAGQSPPQAIAESMQAPLQSFCPAGQVPPHPPAEHVAAPPVMAGQGVHEIPQLPGSVSLRHFPTDGQ